MMKILREGIIVAPELHIFVNGTFERVRADGVPAASLVLMCAERINGNPFAVAHNLITGAACSDEIALGLEIAMAHVVAAKTLDDGDSDVSKWLRIQEHLAMDILDHVAARGRRPVKR